MTHEQRLTLRARVSTEMLRRYRREKHLRLYEIGGGEPTPSERGTGRFLPDGDPAAPPPSVPA